MSAFEVSGDCCHFGHAHVRNRPSASTWVLSTSQSFIFQLAIVIEATHESSSLALSSNVNSSIL